MPDEQSGLLTCDACEKLLSEMLYLTAGERYETIALQKIKDALSKQVGDDADMVPKIETFPKVYTLVTVLPIVLAEGLEDP